MLSSKVALCTTVPNEFKLLPKETKIIYPMQVEHKRSFMKPKYTSKFSNDV